MALLDGLTEDAPILGVDPNDPRRLRPGSRGYNIGVGATNAPIIPDRPILGGAPRGLSVTPGYDAAKAEIDSRPPDMPSMPTLGQPSTGGGILGKPATPSLPAPPMRSDYKTRDLTTTEKILTPILGVLGGARGAETILGRPRAEAERSYSQAMTDYDAGIGAAKSEADIQQKQALAEQERAKADALRNPQAKPDKTVAPESDLYYSLIDQGVPAEEAMRRAAEASRSKDATQQKTTPQQAAFEDYLKQGLSPAQAYEKIRERPPEPAKPSKQLMLVPQPDGSSRAIEVTPGTVVPKGAETAPEFGKGSQPTADEQRRADLSRNMNENLDQLEEILNRRPDLFGWFSGRTTQLWGATGTSDPDIAALKVIKEQMGMAMVGAHAMRNAQHVETAGNAIVNSYHNSPEAVREAIKKARQSLQTFQSDVQKGQGTTPAPAKKGDPLGIL